jgi:hypothetical protein
MKKKEGRVVTECIDIQPISNAHTNIAKRISEFVPHQIAYNLLYTAVSPHIQRLLGGLCGG